MKDKILKIIILILIFRYTIQPAMDLDLGWHLRYGEYFFKTGHVLKDNILSFVWPDYQWVQASWGYDLILYQIFTHFGFIGISVAAAATTTVIFAILTYPFWQLSVAQFLFLAYLFMAHSEPLYSAGFRSQTPSTLLFAIALVVFTKALDGSKRLSLAKPSWVHALPVLFLVWANLHGGFALGLILFIIYWASHGVLLLLQRVKKRSVTPVLLTNWIICGGLLAFSSLTPLANPWGTRIYEETLKHTTNTNLDIIIEWMPLWNFPVEFTVLLAVTALTGIYAFFRRKKHMIPYLLIILVSTYLAMSALRFLIIYAVVITYFWARELPQIRLPAWPWKRWLEPAARCILIILIILDATIFKRFITPTPFKELPRSWEQVCALFLDCSEHIAQVMHAHPPKGNGYHPYNFGGFLTWRVPEVKTFIDGRMAAWEKDGKTPPVVPGDWVNFQKNPVAFSSFDSQYHFGWAIVPTNSYITDYLDGLVSNHLWERQYRDDVYSYYVKK